MRCARCGWSDAHPATVLLGRCQCAPFALEIEFNGFERRPFRRVVAALAAATQEVTL